MLTPQDIDSKAFSVSLRGYSTAEVDDFLQEIIDDFIVLTDENKRLSAQVENLSEAVSKYKAMEDTLNDALGVAGKSAEEIESGASEKADKVIKTAEATANSMISGAEQRIAAEAYRFEKIKREVEIYKTKVIELLNAQLGVLKDYPVPTELNIEDLKENAQRQQLWQRKTDGSSAAFSERCEGNTQEETLPDEEQKEDLTAEADTIDEQTLTEVENDGFEDTTELDSNAVNQENKDCRFVEAKTSDLPCVSIDENGNYVVSKR